MRSKLVLFLLAGVIRCAASSQTQTQTDDPTKKMGTFLGKWQTEGTFAGSANKVTSTLECRWSPQNSFLICEQLVKMTGNEVRQLTVYSYNSKDGNYSFSTFPGPGIKPNTGTVEIKGNIWTYNGNYEAGGKTIKVRTTNEFTAPGTEIFKTESSEDGGILWKPLLQGSAHKVGD